MMGITLLAVLAVDASNPVFLGWSKDGKAAALMQTGEHDGSGFPFGYLEVLSDSGTDRMFYEIACEQGPGPDYIEARVMGSARRYGIYGDKKGTVVKVRKTDSLRTDKDTGYTVIKSYSCDIGVFTIQEEIEQESEYIGVPLRKGKVKMFWQNRPVFHTEINEDALMWWVQEAYIRQGKIAVILGYYKTGFEGPDTRFRLLVFEITR